MVAEHWQEAAIFFGFVVTVILSAIVAAPLARRRRVIKPLLLALASGTALGGWTSALFASCMGTLSSVHLAASGLVLTLGFGAVLFMAWPRVRRQRKW